MQDPSFAVVIITNGPGELSTWVKPIAEKLHQKLAIRPRSNFSEISLRLVLVPCPNSTGHEKEAAAKWDQFELITTSKNFWKLLIRPKKYGFWPSKGLVIFLGGDQFWSVLLSARLGYLHMTYAEWIARWPFWNDSISAMSTQVKKKLSKRYQKRCTVVGDLMADLSDIAKNEEPLPAGKWVALMPGSKKAKLSIGIPFLLETADNLSQLVPNCNFLLPVAPTTSVEEFNYFISSRNPIAAKYNSGIAKIKPTSEKDKWRILITYRGTKIHLQETFPAHNSLSQCDLALTTVGANTAELGALSVPMIVIVPTQHLNVMEAWDGLFGMIARLPGLKWCIGTLVTLWRLRKNSFLAWPNISAGKMIVPEKVGILYPKEVASESASWLLSPHRLKGQKEDLQNLRGKKGAAEKMISEIISLLPQEIREKIN